MRSWVVIGFLTIASVGRAAAGDGVHAFSITDAEGHQSFLIPSLHVPAPEISQPSPAVLTPPGRFLVVEHAGAPVAGDQPGMGLAPWARSLSQDEVRTFAARSLCAGISAQQAADALSRTSVQWANQIAYTSCTVGRRASRDGMLLGAARELQRPVVPLEDDRWVERQRQSVPLAAQEAALHWILARDVDQVLQPVVRAFNRGDFDTVAALSAASWGSTEAAAAAYEPMVIERNARWMEVLPTILAKGGAIIDVGAMHVAGPNGLVSLLRADGYDVQPVLLPAAP